MKELGIREEKIGRMTLRKFDLLWKRHIKYQNPPKPKNHNGKAVIRKEVGEFERVTIDQLDSIF